MTCHNQQRRTMPPRFVDRQECQDEQEYEDVNGDLILRLGLIAVVIGLAVAGIYINLFGVER